MSITPTPPTFIRDHEADRIKAEAAAAHEAALLAAEDADAAVDTTPEPEPIIEERSYMMLQQRTLAQILVEAVGKLDVPPDPGVAELLSEVVARFGDMVVFERLGFRVARNTDHAYRIIAKERLGEQPGRLDLVGIAEKMWKPKLVSSTVRQNYSVE